MDIKMSYNNYREMIKNILETGYYTDYIQVNQTDPFIVLRHDIEFSVKRAYQLHLIENEMGFQSSYFFQITNNSYNTFSKKNIDYLQEIYKNGHKIGLHYHLNNKADISEIKKDIEHQIAILSNMTNINIDRFSFHRPTKNVLKANISIDGIINVYDSKYFTFTENIDPSTALHVKYTADSMHRFNYGYPDKNYIKKYPKLQILIHPYSWTDEGYDNLNNFKTLIAEKNAELIETIDSECKHFGELKDAL